MGSVQGSYPIGNAAAQPDLRFAFPSPETGARDDHRGRSEQQRQVRECSAGTVEAYEEPARALDQHEITVSECPGPLCQLRHRGGCHAGPPGGGRGGQRISAKFRG